MVEQEATLGEEVGLLLAVMVATMEEEEEAAERRVVGALALFVVHRYWMKEEGAAEVRGLTSC